MGYDAAVDSAKLNKALTVTAEAIRSKTGGTDPIAFDMDEGFKSSVDGIVSGGVDTSADTVTPSNLVKDYTAHDAEGKQIVGELDVDAVRDEGYAEGQTAGYNSGYADGKTEGIEVGKKSEYDALWDTIQDNGNVTTYSYAFAYWNTDLFRPKHNIRPRDALGMFYHYGDKGGSGFDMLDVCDARGVVLDFSSCTMCHGAFEYANVRRLGILDLSKVVTESYHSSAMFRGAVNLHTIDSIITPEGFWWNDLFYNCRSLVNITFGGTIGRNGFNIQWSPLSKASITSVVNALSATTTGLTATLGRSAVNTAFETSEGTADGSTSDEWIALVATKSNWTISLN